MYTKIMLVSSLVMTFAGFAQAGTKVAICHKTGSETNPTVLINVSENAVPAQLAQGSYFAVMQNDGSYSCQVSDPVPG